MKLFWVLKEIQLSTLRLKTGPQGQRSLKAPCPENNLFVSLSVVVTTRCPLCYLMEDVFLNILNFERKYSANMAMTQLKR